MRFGLCSGSPSAPEWLEAAFDYVEAPAAPLAGPEGAALAAHYRAAGVNLTNVFFASDVPVQSPDPGPTLDYGRRLLERAAEAGIRLMVVGSGHARRAEDPVAGLDRFLDRIAALQEIATPFGIRLAPEPLNRLETNVGNRCGELARACLARGLDYTADLYHILVEWQLDGPRGLAPDEAHWRAEMPHLPAHVHLADLPRLLPRSGDPMVRSGIARLRELGYAGGVSLECARMGWPGEPAIAMQELRALFG